GADEFLTTDGSRGITHWRWRQGQPFQALPVGKTPPTVQSPGRIASAPLLLPGGPNNPGAICVADHDGNLTLLQSPQWTAVRTWKLGRITAGPFLRGQRIGCIVNRNEIVWIDPANEKINWRFTRKGEGIIGEPQLVNQMLVVADVSGKFIALNPETGQQIGKEYELSAGAAPVATPAAFGANEALVPLTDGTVFVLPLKDFAASHAAAAKQ